MYGGAAPGGCGGAPADAGGGYAALPQQVVPGPVAATYRVMKPDAQSSLGWVVSNDDLRVLSVDAGLPAAAAGITPGMRVACVNSVMVRSVDELHQSLQHGTVFDIAVEMPPHPNMPAAPAPAVPDAGGMAAGGTAGEVDAAWVEVDNPEVGRPYFWNTVTGETTWDHPLAEPLPPGVEEVHVTKEPGEGLGIKLDGMLVTEIVDESPADRCQVHQFIGWRLTHANGEKLGSLDQLWNASQDAEAVALRFEVGEVTVRKDPDAPLGCELHGMILCGVHPGSPLDRTIGQEGGAARYLGQRLTHVNGSRVASVGDVAARSADCDAVMLRFEAEEVEVRKEPGEPLGLVLEGMRLQSCHRASPSKLAGACRFVGRRLTHVDGAEVGHVNDVAAIANAPRDPPDRPVVLRFEPSAEAEDRLDAQGAPGGAGGPSGADPGGIFAGQPPAGAYPQPAAYAPPAAYPQPAASPPAAAPRAASAPAPANDGYLAELERRVAQLEQRAGSVGAAVPRQQPSISPTPAWSPAARILVGPPPWELQGGGTQPPASGGWDPSLQHSGITPGRPPGAAPGMPYGRVNSRPAAQRL